MDETTSGSALRVEEPTLDSDAPPDIPTSLLFQAIWRGRTLIVAVVGACILLSFVYLAVYPRQYTVEAVIGPTQDSSGGAKSALAGIAGVFLGGGGDSDYSFSKFKQVLVSTRLADRLEKQRGVAKRIIGGWDEETHSWRRPSGVIDGVKSGLKVVLGMPPWTPPDASQLASRLQNLVTVDRIGGSGPFDLKTQLLRVSVKMADKDYAVQLLSWILRDSDQIVREDQLTNTTNRIRYLKDLLERTNEVNLNQSLQQILMNEQRTQMTLQADKFYAVDVIDPPHYNSSEFSPRPSMVVFTAVLVGLVASLAMIYIFFRRRVALARSEEDVFDTPFLDPIRYVVNKIRRLFGNDRTKDRDFGVHP